MLRKPQTLNDLKTRTARMVDFADIDDVFNTINSMIEREQPLITLIPKGAGRREDRYAHTLCGEVNIEDIAKDAKETIVIETLPADSNRLDALEARIAVLEAKLGITTDSN